MPVGLEEYNISYISMPWTDKEESLSDNSQTEDHLVRKVSSGSYKNYCAVNGFTCVLQSLFYQNIFGLYESYQKVNETRKWELLGDNI